MNLDEIRFKAIEATRACSNCMFQKESFSTCIAACDEAVRRGLPDCEDKSPSGHEYIYVLDESDPRQLPLLDKER